MSKNLGPQRKKEVIIYLQFSLLLFNIEKTTSLDEKMIFLIFGKGAAQSRSDS